MKIILLLLFITCIKSCFSQEPIELAKRILSKTEILDTANLYSDELDLRPSGLSSLMMTLSDSTDYSNKRYFLPDFTELKSTHTFDYKTFSIHDNYQIINVTAKDSAGKGFDFYLDFKKKNEHWQLSDVRRMSREIVAQLFFVESYTENEVDSIINSDDPYKLIRSREQYDYAVKLHDLALNFDDSIIAYFSQNRDKMEKLKQDYYQLREAGNQLKPNYLFDNNFLLTRITNKYRGLENITLFFVLTNSSQSIGYLQFNDESKVKLLQMRSDVYLREIGNGWYLFKEFHQ